MKFYKVFAALALAVALASVRTEGRTNSQRRSGRGEIDVGSRNPRQDRKVLVRKAHSREGRRVWRSLERQRYNAKLEQRRQR